MPAHLPPLIPLPTQLTHRPGHFSLGPDTTVRVSPGAEPAADLLRTLLAPATGLPLTASPEGSFVLALDPDLGGLGAEGYGLTVAPDAVLLRAAQVTGLLRGVQTVRQLLPEQALSDTPQSGVPWRLPCAEITDVPRHVWRGFMLDVARHFQPVSFLRRYVDLLALHKLNVLHLHLTDDQGWRMPVAAYPRLTEVGGRRSGPVPHEGAYTREELRSLVDHAAARGVTVVPEIEMPGHARAALAAHPELGNVPGRRLDVWSRWGVCDTVFGVHDPVLDFCRTVLDEVVDVFPSPHIHIGGDECPTTEWAASPVARSRAAAEGLAHTDALRDWFLGRIGAFLVERGRTPVAWAETGEGLPPEFTVMTWRDPEHTRIALKRGHSVISCLHRATYLDYAQSDAPADPAAQQGPVVGLRAVHEHDPAGDDIDTAGRLLGSQAQLWTEYVRTQEHVDRMTFPRLCALADRAWHGDPPWPDFRVRLGAHSARLAALGVRHGPLDPHVPIPHRSGEELS
ncbi:beta-N-acetylhexosaminidase [Streptomyces sp. VRA16 Mangrove soil]|uniref:beta-N-acetylhexosaminidase n=1 Tax=Streptomyces sp. VRA16 Mangrove soil TaxID=2817434 RepID=UPI001A9F92FC|nr:beta-N-acetylhexosaminidase [Streptomyces sp. VRA16 Mangrove soil]MBO1330601.1 beta-N-acetylhexosaminidase [Streptomyces sp. VRA16 Mangrove soil]